MFTEGLPFSLCITKCNPNKDRQEIGICWRHMGNTSREILFTSAGSEMKLPDTSSGEVIAPIVILPQTRRLTLMHDMPFTIV